ncbi:cysteine desulfurase family protein [Cellulomonas carbonis]|uniref:cysteine desulfurase family protein n=1 Tax=Cellulomonas carbonis TaxID=1386092 RepID=UPI0005BDBA79|nr:cysteine desulfurase family protein [Cellulomonas carbonis]GGC12276.1 cysteine desulfurase [Cellulomonas carbonis]
MSVYLDHAATTPVHPAVVEAMTAELGRLGNPSSLHDAGRAARRVVEESREAVAAHLGARPSEVVLTAGGTEADNLAVKGVWWAQVARDPARRRVVVSAVEHHAVLDPAAWLAAQQGAEVVLLPVDATGRVDVDALADELARHGDRTALVSVMWANNEVGTVQPVRAVADLVHEHGVPLHVDAVQAVGQLDVDFAASGADALTVSAHKVGGPVGVGALLARRDLPLAPLTHGGGQERGVRSGTVDVVGARALAVALGLAVPARAVEGARLAALRDDLVRRVQEVVPDAVLRGPTVPDVPGGTDPSIPDDGPRRLPANAHLTFPGCEGDSLLYLLDSRGVRCSTGSACRAGVPQPSHVLTAMGVDARDARGALRFSLGRTTTRADVDALVAVVPEVVERARAAGRA